MNALDEMSFDTCMTCAGPIEIYRLPGGFFCSHFNHPDDDHDAVPMAYRALKNAEEQLEKIRLVPTTAEAAGELITPDQLAAILGGTEEL